MELEVLFKQKKYTEQKKQNINDNKKYNNDMYDLKKQNESLLSQVSELNV